MLVFFPGRQIERPWLRLCFSTAASDLLIRLLNVFLRKMLAGFQLGITAVRNAHVLQDPAVANFAVRRFNEAKLIDSRKTRQT